MAYSNKKYKPKYTKEDLEKIRDEAIESNSLNLSNYFWTKKLNEYSSNNTTLINGQTGGRATIVKSYKQWQDLGVQVKKGESAIKIYIPSELMAVVDKNDDMICWKNQVTDEVKSKLNDGTYSIKKKTKFIMNGNVFDIKQTNAKETDFLDSIKPSDQLHSILLDIAKKHNITVEYSNTMNKSAIKSTLGFATLRDTKVINLDGNLDENKMNSVFLHEIAHLELGHLTDKISTEQMEFEAEAVSFIVSSHFGIEDSSSSNNYLKKYYDEDLFTLGDVSDKVLNLSNELIEKIDKYNLVSKEKDINNRQADMLVYELEYYKNGEHCFNVNGITKDINAVNTNYTEGSYQIHVGNTYPVIAELSAGGEYYAHEYDQWVPGKMKNFLYEKDGETQQLPYVECLDKKLIVMDGLWEDVTRSGANNGCGDRFELCERYKVEYCNVDSILVHSGFKDTNLDKFHKMQVDESNYKSYINAIENSKKTSDLKFEYLDEYIGNVKVKTYVLEDLSVKQIDSLISSKLNTQEVKNKMKTKGSNEPSRR